MTGLFVAFWVLVCVSMIGATMDVDKGYGFKEYLKDFIIATIINFCKIVFFLAVFIVPIVIFNHFFG